MLLLLLLVLLKTLLSPISLLIVDVVISAYRSVASSSAILHGAKEARVYCVLP